MTIKHGIGCDCCTVVSKKEYAPVEQVQRLYLRRVVIEGMDAVEKLDEEHICRFLRGLSELGRAMTFIGFVAGKAKMSVDETAALVKLILGVEDAETYKKVLDWSERKP